jgi:hypothetical protein
VAEFRGDRAHSVISALNEKERIVTFTFHVKINDNFVGCVLNEIRTG